MKFARCCLALMCVAGAVAASGDGFAQARAYGQNADCPRERAVTLRSPRAGRRPRRGARRRAGSFAQASAAPRPKVGLVLGGGGARGRSAPRRARGARGASRAVRLRGRDQHGRARGRSVRRRRVAGGDEGDDRQDRLGGDVRRQRRARGGEPAQEAARRPVLFRARVRRDRGRAFATAKGRWRARSSSSSSTSSCARDLGDRNIEELPLPLTLIATDIGTGERVALRERQPHHRRCARACRCRA